MIFESAVRLGSISAAAEEIGLTQPAATHALHKLEQEAGDRLLLRGVGGTSTTNAGALLYRRAARMVGRLADSLTDLTADRWKASVALRHLTDAQVRCHLAIVDGGSFRAAAARLAIAEPTLHRAARELEAVVGSTLYERRPHGLGATIGGRQFAASLRLALLEIEQGLEELANARGAGAGKLSIGCLPLMPKPTLAQAVGAILQTHPGVAISLEENAHTVLLPLLERGDIDMILGALRVEDDRFRLQQKPLFADPYVLVVGAQHPLARRRRLALSDLVSFPWIAPWRDTPRRAVLDDLFSTLPKRPQIALETSSLMMMGAILAESRCVTLLSRSQVESETSPRSLAVLPVEVERVDRIVGITTRQDWLPTPIQALFIELLSQSA